MDILLLLESIVLLESKKDNVVKYYKNGDITKEEVTKFERNCEERGEHLVL